MNNDYYDILGVNKNSTTEEIKNAYRKKAKENHPDRNQGDKAKEEKFKKISEAYEILSDPQKKRNYDQFGSPEGRPQPNLHDFMNFGFNFGMSRPRAPQRVRMNPDATARLNIKLSDAIFGAKKSFSINRKILCEDCDGFGFDSGTETECQDCGGIGVRIAINGYTQIRETCHKCMGSGVIRKACKKCKGDGYNTLKEKVELTINPKTPRGKKLRLRGKGNVAHLYGRKVAGSYILTINYPEEQGGFVYDGQNLHTKLDISLIDIFSETSVEMNLFDKKQIPLQFVHHHDNNKPYIISADFIDGNIYVQVSPTVPTKYVDMEKRKVLIEALREVYDEEEEKKL